MTATQRTTTPTIRAARWVYRTAVAAGMHADRWRYLARALACDLIDAWLPRSWHTPRICPLCRRKARLLKTWALPASPRQGPAPHITRRHH